MTDEVRLTSGQVRDVVAAILAAGVLSAKPNVKPEEALTIYTKVRNEVEAKGLKPAPK